MLQLVVTLHGHQMNLLQQMMALRYGSIQMMLGNMLQLVMLNLPTHHVSYLTSLSESTQVSLFLPQNLMMEM